MRIGIMLRALPEKGGIGVYTKNIVDELLHMDRKNEYILFHMLPDFFGQYSNYTNVKEILVRPRNKAIWDQISIPYHCWWERVDVLFHPKFTAPLLAPCPVVMTVHGADWFMPDQAQYYKWLDVRYIRTVMPLYFKKCTAVISVSQLTTDNFNKALRLPPEKVKTIYFAPARHFQREKKRTVLQNVKKRYQLPDRYILTLTKRAGDNRKNLRQTFRAYALYHEKSINPCKLVVGGKDCYLYKKEYEIPENGYGADILFPGWIDQKDLPAVYSLADLYLYPSNLEAFPIPLTEAMACGTPIVTSNVNGLEEIAGDAALLVDPQNVSDIAEAIFRVLNDSALRQTLSEKALTRSKRFNWDDCAAHTLAILHKAAGS
jgi:glycosyltransferase involved in cell wall biosynthesis